MYKTVIIKLGNDILTIAGIKGTLHNVKRFDSASNNMTSK